ncbi:mitochondrial nicotinamide adenine dinucleotide transporter SLC25A51 [Nilaparvata lugens]|uniref:mitochondrial nicotinamide adenine dinucleotide transporter SLC25A51 n=1 Tax=Nilaparvata lugens TaxID=108931 RepID=UPI00193E06BB|nr:mitochondrial nicotinamide adenine dinucleotide transporter SLC25A51 [Nilaparvata lugens]
MVNAERTTKTIDVVTNDNNMNNRTSSTTNVDNFIDILSQNLNKYLKNSDGIKEFACGWGAALINIGITFPINKIIFRQMLHNMHVGGAYKQIKQEGFVFLYRGILPPLMQKSISTSVMFGIYESCRKPLVSHGLPVPLSNATAAMLAGTIEAVLTPFERVQTLLQDQHYHKHFRNTNDAMRNILVHHGFKEYYRGLAPILLRNGPSNVCFFALRDLAIENIPDSSRWYLNAMKQFLIGAVIGSFISTIFYPCNVLKVHVQSRLGGPYQGIWDATREIYRERGGSMTSFYRGVHMNYTRSFISWGIINVAYDALKSMVD